MAEAHYAGSDWYGGDVGVGGVVAYARHRLTNYEELLAGLEGKPGCDEAYLIVKDRVDGMVRKRLDSVWTEKAEGACPS